MMLLLMLIFFIAIYPRKGTETPRQPQPSSGAEISIYPRKGTETVIL